MRRLCMTESDADRISRLERRITDLQDRNTELVEQRRELKRQLHGPSEIYEAAIAVFGADAQLEIAVEECAKVIVAIKHHGRKRVLPSIVAEEIADAMIALGQARLIVGSVLVDAFTESKLRRLQARVKEAGGEA